MFTRKIQLLFALLIFTSLPAQSVTAADSREEVKVDWRKRVSKTTTLP